MVSLITAIETNRNTQKCIADALFCAVAELFVAFFMSIALYCACQRAPSAMLHIDLAVFHCVKNCLDTWDLLVYPLLSAVFRSWLYTVIGFGY